jgi:hypothetical protein
MTTLRLVGGRDVPSSAADPAHDPTDLFPSPLSPDLLGAVPEAVAAQALASLTPAALARMVDGALTQILLRLDAGEHVENAVLVASALGQLCDRLTARGVARRSKDGAR